MEYIFGFVLLLGVLVFIHELGHFLVAKAFGVRVETFSIGMGPKLFKFKKGETEYVVSLLPMGGYVKLTGQDPREEVPPEFEKGSFRTKPLWQRALVVLAGPAFNAALAIAVMTLLYTVGIQGPGPILERVIPGSPAWVAGFRPGDRVRSVTRAISNRTFEVREMSDLENVLSRSVGRPVFLTVDAKNPREGEPNPKIIGYTPESVLERDSTIGVVKEMGWLKGVEKRASAPVLFKLPGSWLSHQSLPDALWVESIHFDVTYKDGKVFNETRKIESYDDLGDAWNLIAARGTNPVTAKLEVDGRKIQIDEKDPQKNAKVEEPPLEKFAIAWDSEKAAPPQGFEAAGFVSSEQVILDVRPNSPAEKMGLKARDIILKLNGENFQSFNLFKEKIQELAKSSSSIRMEWLRDGKPMSSDVKAESVLAADPLTEVKKEQFQIGASFMALQAPPTMVTIKASNPIQALGWGTIKSYRLTRSMLESFYHLFKGDIAFKTLGGPILIGKIAGESFKAGYQSFLKTMAFISLNLFILNLLPVPVLDGGHLILYIAEAVRRKPINIKIIEVWTTAGFFLLMGLVAFVFFNDLSRLGLFSRFFRS